MLPARAGEALENTDPRLIDTQGRAATIHTCTVNRTTHNNKLTTPRIGIV